MTTRSAHAEALRDISFFTINMGITMIVMGLSCKLTLLVALDRWMLPPKDGQ